MSLGRLSRFKAIVLSLTPCACGLAFDRTSGLALAAATGRSQKVLLDRGALLTLLTFASAPMTADRGGELDGLCAAARQPSLLHTST
jgi:hypothetical protein